MNMHTSTDNPKLAIECRGVGKRYPNFSLNDIDLLLHEGMVMGFVGPNGAGKSTTLRIIMGLVHQDHGVVKVLGKRMPDDQILAKWDIGFASEDMRLHPGQTLDFHLRFMQSIYPSWDSAYATTMMSRFALQPSQRIKELSHGQRVKAALLLVLARRPRLLVFDEPTTGLDPAARQEVLEEMSAVRCDETRSILFSSHNTLDVEQLSDQITFIQNGSILFSENKEDLLDNWRRIRLEVATNSPVPQSCGIINVQNHGHLTVLVTNKFNPKLEQQLKDSGAAITGIERLTLEEIFLTSVSTNSVSINSASINSVSTNSTATNTGTTEGASAQKEAPQ